MSDVWCVRAGGGMYANNFLNGGFVGIGWREIDEDLGPVRTREQLFAVVRRHYPDLGSGTLLSNYVKEIHRFLFEIKPGDHVIVPTPQVDVLDHGVVDPGPVYFDPSGEDGCPLRHRRPVTWADEPIRLVQLSRAFRDSLHALLAVPANTRRPSLLTVFQVEHGQEFIHAIGRAPVAARTSPPSGREFHGAVLDQVLRLTPAEFERLVTHLLAALDVEEGELEAHPAPGGVVLDARGVMKLPLAARIQVRLRFHRGHPGARLGGELVRELRQHIPFGVQGIFISTADFQPEAAAAAREEGFAPISLVSGDRLADLISQHRDDLPEEIRDRLPPGQAPAGP